MPQTVTSEQQTLLNSGNLHYTHQDEEEVREFLAQEPATVLSLEKVLPIIEDVFGDQVKPLLLVAHDPDGSQYDRLMALVSVKGDIDFALDLLAMFRQKLFNIGILLSDKLCVDVEIF